MTSVLLGFKLSGTEINLRYLKRSLTCCHHLELLKRLIFVSLMCSCVLHALLSRLTIDGGATDQVGVGEVERSVQEEGRLQRLPHLLAQVEEQTSALQRDLPLLSELWEEINVGHSLSNEPALTKT